MANSRRKNGGCTRGRFKRKKLGKGWSTLRKERAPERVVLRITDPEPAEGKGDAKAAAARAASAAKSGKK